MCTDAIIQMCEQDFRKAWASTDDTAPFCSPWEDSERDPHHVLPQKKLKTFHGSNERKNQISIGFAECCDASQPDGVNDFIRDVTRSQRGPDVGEQL